MATQNGSTSQKAEYRARKRLLTRLNKEFEKKFFIGDIVISDQEYALLLKETREILVGMIRSSRAVEDSVVLSVTLVQVGIRKYDGKHFWPYAEEELRAAHHHKNQQLLGEAFINTLRKHGKHITDASERVQNILFHTFVSNYYSKGLFELLFQYYSKDLERDIYRNTTEQMQALMDTLAQKATLDEQQSERFADQFMGKGSRAYKLRSHTLQAISALPVHSRVRLRRLLRLIDRAFWNNAVPQNPTSRLTILFKDWINDSPAYKKEYHLYQLGEIRNRGKKHFSTPYLFAQIALGTFELKLPAQIVSEEYAEGLEWEISTCDRTIRIAADTYPVLTGYKTEDGKIPVSKTELYGEIQCQLVSGHHSVRKFPHLPASCVRFFDMEGDFASRLFKIPMCAYTGNDNVLCSGALISKVPHGNITRWDFEFQQGDLVVLPDGTGIVVGDHYTDGLVPRGRIPCAEYRETPTATLPVYATAPELLLTIPKGKLPGTILYFNGTKVRLTDCRFTEFENKDSRGVQAVVLPLDQFEFCGTDGIKRVVLDVPGASYDRVYEFVLIQGLSVDFLDAPYVFEERGVVLFPEHIHVRGNYEKVPYENGYQFELKGNDPELHVTICNTLPLTIKIPMLSWSVDKENWQVLPAGELWHTEFLGVRKLYMRSPISKIHLFSDSDVPDDEDSENRRITAEFGADGIYTLDLTRFRSWLTRDIMKNDILLKLGGEEYKFATVYTKSLVVSYDVNADYEEGTLTWVSDIIGKAEYYLDVTHLGTGAVLVEKGHLQSGQLVVQDSLRSGRYRFTLYEAEEDDSGFDDPVFEELLCVEQQLVNRNNVSGQVLKVRSFKSAHGSNLYTEFQKEYFVTELEKIEKNVYAGQLLTNGEDSGLKVEITFLKESDLRFFHMTAWHEGEELFVDLLFDRNHLTLELDQAPGLRASESYRRYRELVLGEYVYFGTLYDCLPTTNCTSDPTRGHQTAENVYEENRAIPVERMGLSNRSCHVLLCAGIRCAGDIQQLTTDQWYRIRNMGKHSMHEIAAVMKELGLTVQLDFSADRTKNVGEVQPSDLVKSESGSMSVEELGISPKIRLTLGKYGVITCDDLAQLSPDKWLQLELELGNTSLLEQKMKQHGIFRRRV